MATKETFRERTKGFGPSLGRQVEHSGLSLGELVEQSTGCSLGAQVEATIGNASPAQGPAVTAEDLLRYLMIPGTCLGFHQLGTAINFAVEDENRLLNVIDDLYPLVGEVYHATPNSIQKNMRMAIIAGWKNGGKEQMEKLMGLPFRNRPVTKDFIDLLADYLRRRTG